MASSAVKIGPMRGIKLTRQIASRPVNMHNMIGNCSLLVKAPIINLPTRVPARTNERYRATKYADVRIKALGIPITVMAMMEMASGTPMIARNPTNRLWEKFFNILLQTLPKYIGKTA